MSPLTGADIAGQQGAAQGLWSHSPVDWAGNEPPGTAKPSGWPNNAKDGYLGTATGTRPGGAVTQTPSAPGAPTILSAQVTNVTTTGFGIAVVFGAAVTASQLSYGLTPALGSTAAGTTAAAQTISASGLVTKTTYYVTVQGTNAQGTTVSNVFVVTTF